jgi:hypothetical protein
MHGLCLGCHREEEKGIPVAERSLSRCTTCHRAEFGSDSDLRQGLPFAPVSTADSAETEIADAAGSAGGSP